MSDILQRINQKIDHFEPLIRLLYRIGVVLVIYFGLTHIGNSLYVEDSAQQDTSCQPTAPSLKS